MNNTCDKCLGTGLIGNGDNPHLHQGKLVTCDKCGGTGKTEASAPDEQKEVAPEEPETSDIPSETVAANDGKSFLQRIFG